MVIDYSYHAKFEPISSNRVEKGTIACYQTCYMNPTNRSFHSLLINHILSITLCFSSQSGRFPLMLAANPDVIKALRQAAATEQVNTESFMSDGTH